MKKKLPVMAVRMSEVSIVVVFIILLSAIGFRSITNTEEKYCQDVLDNSAQSISNEIQHIMNDNINILKLASGAIVRENTINNPEAVTAYISEFQHMTIFERVDLLYPDNRLLLQNGEIIDAAGMLSFEDISATGEHMSGRTTDVTAEQTPVIRYYVPINQETETVAVLVGVIDCFTLSPFFKAEAYDDNAYVCIVDYSDGSFIMDEWYETFGNINDMTVQKQAKEFEHINLSEEVKNARTGVIEYVSSLNGKDFYVYYTPVGIFSWELLLVVEEDAALGNLKNIQRILYGVGFAESVILIVYFVRTLIANASLEKNRQEVQRQLTISDTLVQCIKMLSDNENTEEGINYILKIIGDYFGGDRAYIFEINYETQLVKNTYEYAREGVTKEIDNLQDIPISAIEIWIEEFKKSGMFTINSLDKDVDKNSDTYRILAQQNINSLIALPLIENGVIIGFLGIDNPTQNFENVSLISSTAYFLVNNLKKRSTQALLERLSFEDTLTQMYNRNKYNIVISEYQDQKPVSLGLAYFDLNGLKVVNDKYGHKAGDLLIKNTAACICSIFEKNSYRIGGDEFVTIIPNIAEEEFYDAVHQALELLKEKDISISVGTSWKGKDNDIGVQMHEADSKMYENKKQYYMQPGKNRRNRG